MSSPDDMSQFENLLNEGEIKAEHVVCIIAKTEGNGRVNDFSRPLAHRAFRRVICDHAKKSVDEVEGSVAFVMSGGCEGIMSPHATVFVREPSDRVNNDGAKKLTFATANTRKLLPEEIGTLTQVDLVATGVKQAICDAEIESIDDVHYVQVKCPILTSERINEARSRGQEPVTVDTLRSLGYSNGASALGIAVGLREIDADIKASEICSNEKLYTDRGGASAGIELMNLQIFVMGNSKTSASHLVIGHHRLDDLIDADGVRQAIRSVGIDVEGSVKAKDQNRIINVFAKGQVPLDGLLRGRRTTLLTDSDLNTRPARAVLSSVIASIVGDPAIYVSAGWGYHQGPTGGGIAAVIAKA